MTTKLKQDLEQIFSSLKAQEGSRPGELIEKALVLSRHLHKRARSFRSVTERRRLAMIARMVQAPEDKATVLQLIDESLRPNDPKKVIERLAFILNQYGLPRCFRPMERALLSAAARFGHLAPQFTAAAMKEYVRWLTRHLILPGESEPLRRHLQRRHQQGFRTNVNFLGEAILGEYEARRRLQTYLNALQWPEIEVVSIKISSLYSQLSPLARRHTVQVLGDRLEQLFRTAARLSFTRPDGTSVPKFVYLDMERYSDLQLTVDAFIHTLERRGMEEVSAGIALQAYIPDSYELQQRLNQWARERVRRGGAPITIRLVKGANLEMERVEASLRGWPQAPYKTKLETDANFKRMLHEALKPENIEAVRLGVASHNLFDIAYAIVLAHERGLLDRIQIEMLEGMAESESRALLEIVPDVLLYVPACPAESFISAMAYLIRRFDENTSPENFLRYAFELQPDTPIWHQLERSFIESCKMANHVSSQPRRRQNRFMIPEPTGAVDRGWRCFVNEPDTDFSLRHNCLWAEQIIEEWKPICDRKAIEIPLQVAGEDRYEGRPVALCWDPSRPGVFVARYRRATADDIAEAVSCAAADPDRWRARSVEERFTILGAVAQRIREKRADLMGAALADGGKILSESDPEVSEAVDFVEFYRESAREWFGFPTLKATPKGVVVVVSPWNFPISIPCGGIAAALAAGNTVILKPASDAVLPAYFLCQCFWEAGVPKRALQFVPCSGQDSALKLVTHPAVDVVVLTGGTETALAILAAKPDLNLIAETGGKNATIVTAMADLDEAVRHVVHSAFSHSGQKCSATSLLLLERVIYEDRRFRQALCDAAASLSVGSAWDLQTKVGPLIRPPSGKLERALKTLDAGEEWALRPEPSPENPNLWSPGIKYGVQPGSMTHMTELFGPVLAVMPFDTLEQAVELVNQTGYGLTAGLETLDEREIEFWRNRIRAGNLYVNRPTTGAIVLRQPFGGMGKSAFGMGIKVGGPNYVTQFMNFEDQPHAPSPSKPVDPQIEKLYDWFTQQLGHCENYGVSREEWSSIQLLIPQYERWFREEFGVMHDHFKLLGEDNLRYYRPLSEIRIRITSSDSAFDIFARVIAAIVCGTTPTISIPPGLDQPIFEALRQLSAQTIASVRIIEEDDEQLAHVIRNRQVERVRYADRSCVPPVVWEAAARSGVYIVTQPVLHDGRIELLCYMREQSFSYAYHRYGNLGRRINECRTEPL